MNTSGISFRDHASSMVLASPSLYNDTGRASLLVAGSRSADVSLLKDLCNAALTFASDTLRSGGHFLCKIYQGAEDKLLERKLRMMFAKVHREKPEASRSVSLTAHLPSTT